MAANTGNAVPWRAFTPSPVYGVVAGASKPMRGRTVPKGCQYLTQNFLPSLFTFSKDEMPLAFGGN